MYIYVYFQYLYNVIVTKTLFNLFRFHGKIVATKNRGQRRRRHIEFSVFDTSPSTHVSASSSSKMKSAVPPGHILLNVHYTYTCMCNIHIYFFYIRVATMTSGFISHTPFIFGPLKSIPLPPSSPGENPLVCRLYSKLITLAFCIFTIDTF